MKTIFAPIKERIVCFANKAEKAANRAAMHVMAKFTDTSGEGATEHTGWIAIGLIIVAAVIAAFTPWGQNTVIPAIKEKMMGFINYSG